MVQLSHAESSPAILPAQSKRVTAPMCAQAIVAAACTALTMMAFEIVKQWLFPPVSISRSISDLCFTGFASVDRNHVSAGGVSCPDFARNTEPGSRSASAAGKRVTPKTFCGARSGRNRHARQGNELLAGQPAPDRGFHFGSELIGRNHYRLFHDIPERSRQIHQPCLEGSSENCEEGSFQLIDGSTEWLCWDVHPWQKGNGTVGGLIIFSEIITARKNVRASARLAEQKYRNHFLRRLLSEFSRAHPMVDLCVNSALARMLGYDSAAEMLGAITNISQQVYVDPQRREEFRVLMQQNGWSETLNVKSIARDGRKIWLSVNAGPFPKKVRSSTTTAPTRILVKESFSREQLLRSQNMEAIGRLARGVAHDFDNSMGVVVGYSSLLKGRVLRDEKAWHFARRRTWMTPCVNSE